MENFLSEEILDKLINGKSISGKMPWASLDEKALDNFYRTICDNACRDFSLFSKIQWDDYGSGYASYIDAWFYRDNEKFKKSSKPEYIECTGLVILFSKLSPYFVAGEASKSWHTKGGSSYLPAYELVDKFTSQEVIELLKEVEPYLLKQGLVRLHKDDLSQELPSERRVPTILCDPPYRVFDALFHWED